MKTHELKSWPDHFDAILDGRARAQVRYNDRDYQAGDHLMLREWSNAATMYTGRAVLVRVTHALELTRVLGLSAGEHAEEGKPWAALSIVREDAEMGYSQEWLERA